MSPVQLSQKSQDNNANWMGDKIERKQLKDIREGIFAISFLIYLAVAHFLIGIPFGWNLLGSLGLAALTAVFPPVVKLVAKLMFDINMRK